MSDITQNIEITPIDLSITVDTNQLSFTPDVISLNLYAGGVGTSNSLDADISNVHILGGTNGYVLQTDGTGNLSWTAQTGGGGSGSPGGADTQVQYNNGGLFGGNSGFTFNSTSGNLNVPGNIIAPNFIGTASFATTAGYAPLSDVANTANIANTANTVVNSAQPNITSVGILTSLSVSGNISSGNANLGNLAKANYFQGDGSLLTNITVIGNSISNGTSNVSIPAASGNINFNVNANTNVFKITEVDIIATGNANITNTVNAGNFYAPIGFASANYMVTNQVINGTAKIYIAQNGNLTFAANGTNNMTITNSAVTSRQFISNIAIGTAPFIVTSTTMVDKLNVANANFASTARTLIDSAELPNIYFNTSTTSVYPLANAVTSLGWSGGQFKELYANAVYANAGNIVGNNITFKNSIKSDITPTSATSTVVTHKIPIVLNGVTYYVMLTNTP